MREGRREARVVRGRPFAARAGAAAQPKLRVHAGAARWLQSQQLRAEPVRSCHLVQHLLRLPPGVEHPQEPFVIERPRRQRPETRRRIAAAWERSAHHDTPACRPRAPVMEGRQRLDEMRFKQERAQLAEGRVRLDPRGLLAEPHLSSGAGVSGEVRQHAPTDVPALADVQRHARRVIEDVHPGRVRDGLHRLRLQMRRQGRTPEQALQRRREPRRLDGAGEVPEKIPHHTRIPQGAMAVRARKLEPLHEAVQVVVLLPRVERPGQPDGAQTRGREGPVQPLKFVADEAVVEARVVRDEHAAVQQRPDLVPDLGEGRRPGHVRVRDPRQPLDHRRDAALRIHECRVRPHDRPGFHPHDPDLDDAVERGAAARRLHVHDRELHRLQHQPDPSPADQWASRPHVRLR